MTQTECNRCKGTGARRDATLADKVCAAGTTRPCSTCSGKGYIERLTREELIAEAEAFLARS